MSEASSAVALPFRPPESILARRTRYLRELYASRYLVRYLTTSSLRAESVGLWFGFLWWCFDPLLRMLTYTLIVSVILRRGDANFPIFVMSALLPWQFFVKATRNSIAETSAKTRRMRQIAFPRAVIPLAATLGELMLVLAALVLFLLFAMPFGVYPAPIVLLALPMLAILLAITLGFAFFFSALSIFVPDTEQAVGHMFRLWMFLSPVLYDITRVPTRFRLLYELNPFAEILQGFRSVLFLHEVPALLPMAAVTAASFAILAVGFGFFVATERAFVKRA